ncbi:MAG: ABC transporter permease subunit [Crocinitomicaceae bacterium]|nr:ABC transporter permease subunit [Taishania sp.]
MRALYFKEIRSFLSSIIGFIFVFIFLVATGIFHWIVPGGTNFLEGAEADLIPFFNLAPILFFILIPALTMRSIAEERRTGTIELLFTRPISDLKIILAKYFAGVTLLVIALIPTVIYYISMYNLALEPEKFDHGATITSYFGLILLGAVFVAIGIFSSSLTSSQIVAFIISMFLCWLFFDGLNRLGAFNLMGQFDVVLQYFGMVKHYDSIRKGVIDTSDVIYFFSLIVFFIFSALTVIKTLKK